MNLEKMPDFEPFIKYFLNERDYITKYVTMSFDDSGKYPKCCSIRCTRL
jgi:hypothetical protein